MKRLSRFKAINGADLEYISNIIGNSNVLSRKEDVSGYSQDWTGAYSAQGPVHVIRPKTTKEVSKVLKYCNDHNIAVTPQGGNTGLVGGSVPLHDELILSLNRMNQIDFLDDDSNVLQCDAGCVLATLEAYANERGFTVPIDLGAKGSCQIGGNVSTNAGGIRVLRYGNLHANITGLEAVLPDGSILSDLTTLRKDNTGYHLKHLFIGAEGTLGVVSKVSILLYPKPAFTQLAFLGVSSFDKAIEILKESRSKLGDIISAVEFQDRESLEVVLKHDKVKDPLETKSNIYMIIEGSGFYGQEEVNSSRLEVFLSTCFDKCLIDDGIISQNSSQINSLWRFREGITECLTHKGKVFKYDVSIPVEHMYDMVETMRDHLYENCKVPKENIMGYGHVGDQNLHLNIWVDRSLSKEVKPYIEPFVYEQVSKLGGSISAEHGLGQMKPHLLHYSKSPIQIDFMKKIKDLYDPRGILNPYKVII